MAEDGKVVYKFRGDDSDLDKDIGKAEGKLGNFGSVAGKIGKTAGVALAAVGSAAVAVGVKAVTAANDLQSAMNQFATSTGTAKDELDKYEDVLKKIYTNNYGEDFNDIANAMSLVKQQLGDLDPTQMQEVTESAFALQDVFDYDISESVRAANALINNFGVDGSKAFDFIATGAQKGLDFSGDFLDSISEYSVQFAKVGLSAEDMFAIFEKGAESGAYNVDKIADAIKELSIKAIDGSNTTAEGFSIIGLNADEMAAKFAAGGETAKQAFNQTIQALAALEDPVQQNLAGVNLFGTMWEDLGPKAVTALADIESSAYDTAGAMDTLKTEKYSDLGSMLEALGRTLETLLIPLGETLIPIISQIVEKISPLMEEVLPKIMEILQPLFDELGPLVDEVLTPLIDELLMPLLENLLPPLIDIVKQLLPPIMEIFQALLPLVDVIFTILEPILDLIEQLLPPLINLLDQIAPLIEALMPLVRMQASLFSDVLGAAVSFIIPIIGNLINILADLLGFITDVFTGDWEGAWEHLVGFVTGILNQIPSALEGVLNAGIDLLNSLIKGVNKILGAVGIGEIGLIGHVTLPRFHDGGIVNFKTAQEGLAVVKNGEMILTQAQQKQLFDIANARLAGVTAGAGQTTNFYQTINSHDALSPSEMTREAENFLKRAKWRLP